MQEIYRSSYAIFFWISIILAIFLSLGPAGTAIFAFADDATSTPPAVSDGTDASSTPPAPAADASTASTTAGESGTPAEVPGQITTATSTDGTGGIADQGGTVMTGDAAASTTVSNELNTNTTSPDAPGTTNSSTITASTTNTGVIGGTASSTATTGENEADGGEGLATIVTGSALSTANVINVINTNIFNSEGLILFLNQLFGGGLDLRTYDLSYFFGGPTHASSTAPCTLLTCLNSSALNVVNTNTATVTNSVIVRASTGENTATSSGAGDASIATGDAYAAANVFNLANTNIINSNYLLVSFNNFGNLSGDITLPSAEFFKALFQNGGAMPELNASTYGVNSNNDVQFTGTTTADALTGGNTASTTEPAATTTSPLAGGEGSGSGDITTGSAYTSANTYTAANTNQVGGTSLFLLFRVWGNWTGSIQGLPDGIRWMQTPNGIELVSDNSSTTPPLAVGTYNSSSFLATSTNTANVENNVQVYALTGENQAHTESGDASVSTGNAYAAANVVNLINTNVVGRNWIFAIFNIFGDWSGNISFGKPDLWIGAVAETPNPTPPGSAVKYRFTVKNNGDLDATNVTLTADFDGGILSFGSEGAPSSAERGLRWDLGTVPRGETREFEYTARVASGAGTATVPLTATVAGAEADNDTGDNTETVTLMVADPAAAAAAAGGSGGGGGGGGGGMIFASVPPSAAAWTPNPAISIEKSASTVSASAPATVDYKVVVMNGKNAGPLYGGVLTDTLYDPAGGVMYNRSWNLDTVAPGDEITLTYSVAYGASTTPGTYKNVARLTGKQNYYQSIYAADVAPIEASKDVTFSATGEVLGIATSTEANMPAASTAGNSCTPILTTYLRPGNRSPSVQVLQLFLNRQGSRLPVTGYFGPMTTAAVKNFQRAYAADILEPAGLKTPSGLVYSMTLNAINRLSCGSGPAPTVSAAAGAGGNTAAAPAKKAAVSAKPAPKKTVKKPAPAAAQAPAAPAQHGTAQAPAPKKGFGAWLRSIIPVVSAQAR